MRRVRVKHLLMFAAAALTALTAFGAPAAAQDVLFEDAFDGDLSQWTVVSGTWAVNEGKAEGTGPGTLDLRTKRDFSGDLVVEFTVATGSPIKHPLQCILFTNAYSFLLGSGSEILSAIRRRSVFVAQTDRMTIEPGREYAVTIMRRGGDVEFIVDGKLLLSWTDTKPSGSGPIVLLTGQTRMVVDNFRVRSFPATPVVSVVNAQTGRPLSAKAVKELRASRDCAAWQPTRLEDSSRIEPVFMLRTKHRAYLATFHGYPTEYLDDYDDLNWFCHAFAGWPALRVRLHEAGPSRPGGYAEAAGHTTSPFQQGDNVLIEVAGMAAGRTTGGLELFYGPKGGTPKRIAAVAEATLSTSSETLASHTFKLETAKPGTYQVIARLTRGSAVMAYATATFHVMGPDELFDAGNGFRLRRGGFIVDIDARRGAIKGLFEDGGRWGTNYVANETNHPIFGQYGSLFFGDVLVTSRLSGLKWRNESTALSEDVRQVAPYKGGVLVSYAEKSNVADGGFQNVRLWERYRANPAAKTLDWDIFVENAQSFPIEIGEIALPLFVNDTFFGLIGKRDVVYTQRVFAYPHIGGHSGFVLVQRLLGDPPYLLIVPAEGTAFEEVAVTAHATYQPRTPDWFGLRNLHLFSAASAEIAGWKPGPNPNTSITLEAGERRRFGLRMTWVRSIDEIPAALFRLGKIGIQVAPGMVVPTNQTASLLCWSQKPIRKVQPLDEGITIVHTSSKAGVTLYVLRFESEGRKRLRLYTAPDEWTMVAFDAVPPIETLIDARARFIAENQQYHDPEDVLHRDAGFLPWDASIAGMAEFLENPSPILGCSDLGGFADPLFLAEKNVYRPNEQQVRVLEEYVERCLFKHVQDPETYTIRASLYVDPQQRGAWPEATARDTSRTYNYAFAINIYYALYRIGSLYGLTQFKQPKAYLEMAADTAIVMFDDTRWPYEGQPAGGTVLDVLEALQREELADKHAALLARVEACRDALERDPFPYGSQAVYNPTGTAQVYRFFRRFGSSDKAQQALRVMLAVRGKQPLWYHYGTDRLWYHFYYYGKRRTHGDTGLCYSSAVNGAALLDGYRQFGERQLLLQGYAGVLGAWAGVAKSGIGSTGYHVDPRIRAFDELSTAGGIGLWGSLQGLGAYLVHDPHFGVIGFGCDVSTSGGYTIVPKDGLFKRAFFQPVAIGVDIDVGRLTKVATTSDGAKVWVAFTVDQWFEKKTTVTVTGLRPGPYRVTANDKAEEIRVEEAALVLPPIETKGGTNLVVIERIEEKPPKETEKETEGGETGD